MATAAPHRPAPQAARRRELDSHARALENGSLGGYFDLVRIPRIVKRRPAFDSDWHASTNGFNPADKLSEARLALLDPDRHIVDDLNHSISQQEAGDQDIGIGPVDLLAASRHR